MKVKNNLNETYNRQQLSLIHFVIDCMALENYIYGKNKNNVHEERFYRANIQPS